jgi:hypothetical protein
MNGSPGMLGCLSSVHIRIGATLWRFAGQAVAVPSLRPPYPSVTLLDDRLRLRKTRPDAKEPKETIAMTLDEFLQNNNISRYRRLLVTLDEAQRKTISELLNEELAKQRQAVADEPETAANRMSRRPGPSLPPRALLRKP